ncbi:hypothetical protein [uncultured Dietzia sp.]|uniref:hypothetical protein n=1 Tax=uncultured Dietzia sp. TaxID=395519 RepID=UPI00260601DE|nr:hypothetical protein [uncultured Dietzia sp.]
MTPPDPTETETAMHRPDRTHPEDPDTRAIADRARLSYAEASEMLAGFRAALRQADAETTGDGGDDR